MARIRDIGVKTKRSRRSSLLEKIKKKRRKRKKKGERSKLARPGMPDKINDADNADGDDDDELQENLAYIRQNYANAGHPIAYSTPGTVYKYMKSINRKTKMAAIREALQDFDAYNLFKSYRRPAWYNPYYIYGRRMQIQADLVDVRQLSEQNDGVKYIFVLIDAFTRKAWAYGLKNKTSKETAEALRKHIEQNPASRMFREIMTDKGNNYTDGKVVI